MKSSIRTAIGLVVAATLLIPGTASAAQMKATDEPTTSDTLTPLTDKCSKKKERDIGGDVIAVAEACLYFYGLQATEETDLQRDYGVAWLQSYVDAKNGWCVREVVSDIVIPSGAQLHATEPGDKSPDEKKRVKTKLKVDAAGSAADPATAKQSYVLYPEKMKTSRKEGNGEDVSWHLKWSGRKAKPLGFASGAEVSWAVEDGPPPNLQFELQYFVEQTTNC